MRIFELEIHNIRGIPSLKIKPQGKNFLISGPNGTGKSSVVDAIDFLLTGDITRLTGTGTRGISLKEHGRHLNAKETAFVSAIISLNGHDKFSIKRTMQTPGELIVDEKYRQKIESVLNLAREGQHILTRREILRYIATEPAKRLDRIQALLNLARVEEMRGSLVSLEGDFRKQLDKKQAICQSKKSDIATILGDPNFNERTLLDSINELRKALDCAPLDKLDAQGTVCVKDIETTS